MVNRAMERMLADREAVDVRRIGEKIGPDVYVLREYEDGVDYCDAVDEVWIWSIGRERATGRILAATDGRYYLNPSFECLWLR